MDASVKVCPVPPEQRPINEYQELKESCCFGWTALALRTYVTKILGIWSVSWLLISPVTAASFPPLKYPLRFFLSGAAGTTVILGLALLRLYLGWRYVGDRLRSPTVIYEESGWYDGQIWVKPPEVLAQDQLIVTYQIQPLLQRLNHTLKILTIFILVSGFSWSLLSYQLLSVGNKN